MAVVFISSKRLWLLLLEAPSVPRQTFTFAFIIVLRGAMPDVSLRLLTVQLTTLAFLSARR